MSVCDSMQIILFAKRYEPLLSHPDYSNCCISCVADYHVHCDDDRAVRLRDGRLFSCDASTSGQIGSRELFGHTPSAQSRKRPAASPVEAVLDDSFEFYTEGAQGVEEAAAIAASHVSGSGGSACASVLASPTLEVPTVTLYATQLQSFFAMADCPGVTEKHPGSFCIPDWSIEKSMVSLGIVAQQESRFSTKHVSCFCLSFFQLKDSFVALRIFPVQTSDKACFISSCSACDHRNTRWSRLSLMWKTFLETSYSGHFT